MTQTTEIPTTSVARSSDTVRLNDSRWTTFLTGALLLTAFVVTAKKMMKPVYARQAPRRTKRVRLID